MGGGDLQDNTERVSSPVVVSWWSDCGPVDLAALAERIEPVEIDGPSRPEVKHVDVGGGHPVAIDAVAYYYRGSASGHRGWLFCRGDRAAGFILSTEAWLGGPAWRGVRSHWLTLSRAREPGRSRGSADVRRPGWGANPRPGPPTTITPSNSASACRPCSTTSASAPWPPRHRQTNCRSEASSG